MNIEEELKESYLNYAMSVIISRALPDVRDGLKPSQRRILVAMRDLVYAAPTRGLDEHLDAEKETVEMEGRVLYAFSHGSVGRGDVYAAVLLGTAGA